MVTEDTTIFAQVSLSKSQLEKLKRRSGMLTTEEALQTAVSHYLGCPEISTNLISGSARGEREREKEKEGGEEEGEGLILVAGKVKKPNNGHGNGHEPSRNRNLLAL